MKNGVIVRITPTRLPDGNILYRMSFDHPDSAGKLRRLQAPVVIALPGHSFGIQIGANKNPDEATTEFDSVGFSFKPKTAEN